ncbi:nuclear transport factor 2 family protein [Nocardioides sambongensis]|uniref:nuclear transport factor 2 family protein n=1 Tax=Nocardioides sambongensis TaxID=2589074 RepID=UPI00112E5909|nr:nuclear transport factor 2 family protein [Nocardioides sambongensis]
MNAVREAIEAKDMDAVEALLADDVVFRSPVAFKPYPGKAITTAILRSVVEVFEDFRYVRQMVDGPNQALVFEAKVDGLEITGCDFLVLDDEGKVVDFMVMVRPLKAAQALSERMAERFPAIQAAAQEWMERNAG